MSDIKDFVCSFSNLYIATQKCRRNVRWKDSVASFTNHSLTSVYKLKKSIEDETYEISPYSIFYVHEPKERLITSTRFKDRVFQRSLCDNYLYDSICANFIKENCACQKKKGTDYARNVLDDELRSFFKESRIDGWILKCDLKDYFGSTPHQTAKNAVRERVGDDWSCSKVDEIIDSFDKGIGLGSQVSQLIQLAVLDEMDHLITREMGIRHYVRYMDDFILIDHNKRKLEICRKGIQRFLESKGLRLSDKKTHIQKVSQPFRFLGFSFKLWPTGKVTWKLPDENTKNEKRRLRSLVYRSRLGGMTKEAVDKCYQSWRAHAKKGDSRGKMLKMDRYYKNLWRNKNEG